MFQNDFMGTVSLSVDEVKDASKVNLLFLLYLFVLLYSKWAINRLVTTISRISKIQLVAYYQCCILIG